MRNWIRTALSMLGAAATALTLVVAPASADGTTQFSGVGRFDTSGQCTELVSLIPPTVMAGDLVGCLYVTSLEVHQNTPSGSYVERGTETFIGCLSDGTTCGTFDTTYVFTAKFADDGSEIHGRCEHPILGGTGDFEGITGWFHIKDDVETGDFNYSGHIDLP